MSKEIVRGLTFRSFILGLVLTTFWVFSNVFFLGFAGSDLGIWPTALTTIFIMSFVMSFLRERFRLTTQELSVIYCMMLVTVIQNFNLGWWFYLQKLGVTIIKPYSTALLRYVYTFWSPKDPTILRGALIGGAVVPWDAWLIPMIMLILTTLSYVFFSYFFALLWRKPLIEVQRLTFPYAIVAVNTIKPGVSLFKRGSENRLFWIGALIGAALYLPGLLHSIWSFLPTLPMDIDLTPAAYSYLPGAFIRFWLWPWMVAAGFLAPMDILFTTWVWYIINLIILPVLEVRLGWRPVPPLFGDTWSFLVEEEYWSSIIKPGVFAYGIIIGVSVWLIISNRRYLLDSIKAAFSKSERDKWIDEPVSPIWIWVGLIGSAILLFGIITSVGTPVILALIMMGWMILLNLGNVMIRATAGGYMLVDQIDMTILGMYDIGAGLGYWSLKGSQTTECFATMHMTFHILGYSTRTNLMPYTLESYKIAKETDTDVKNIFRGQVVAILLAVLIMLPTMLWASYTYGLNRGFAGSNPLHWMLDTRSAWNPWIYVTSGGPTVISRPYALQYFIGIISAYILMFLRTRWVWFPINPIGIVLGSGEVLFGVWSTFLIAWILKFTVLRIGGSKLYEKLIPLMVGIIIGSFLITFATVVSNTVISMLTLL